jgi:hypothetical protein
MNCGVFFDVRKSFFITFLNKIDILYKTMSFLFHDKNKKKFFIYYRSRDAVSSMSRKGRSSFHRLFSLFRLV